MHAATLALALVAAGATAASAAIPANLTERADSATFRVHYTSAAGDANAIAPAAAQALADASEQAAATEESRFGFPTPVLGSDGKVGIYVYNFTVSGSGERAVTVRQNILANGTARAAVFMPPSRIARMDTITHEIFHVLQFGVSAYGAGAVVQEATAVWAQRRVAPDAGFTIDLQPDQPIDCSDTAVCGKYARYRSWPFIEFLSERYGDHIVREMFDAGLAMHQQQGTVTTPGVLSAVLAARGSTLADAYRDFALAELRGDLTFGELQGDAFGGSDTLSAPTIRTRGRTATLTPRSFTVAHLATRYMSVIGGPSSCHKAKLRLDITAPAAATSAVGYSVGNSATQRLALVNGRGRLTLPWKSCDDAELGLALINADPAADNAAFQVGGRIVVPKAKRRRRH